ncbi:MULTISPECIES: 2-hydroxycarboxylate transporter family protein [Enterocloster]|mgnify:FL=1|uniref:Na+/citrate or Na+/malate symporter n=1 Tax=Enterocloster lavalensis TaxID=460384 RepID=A0A1I0K653_9FIRM|nr:MULTISPECIES: 2-hydroxycarboxylate transporter family protein [Enterocloster]MBS5605782.1 2-hydroxycarboxylate transporter family protein [Enterocloster asparagiformis]MDR3758011.1 2-hydroxycarboxylate transporter family protein [Enterocloster sp.]PST30499.1 Na+/citrate symporter [Enterocloster lavalensis]SEU19133.1 Na+/citrate or Na+/malate symporter [Enterocloster lavalensis]
MKALKDTRILGMPLAFYLVLTVATLFISIRGNLLDNMIGAIACSLLIGTGLGVIGDKIPIWNQWLGGGILFANLAASAITTFKVLPESTIQTLDNFNNGTGFLEMFVVFLILGSILSVDRDLLMKSFLGYIPTILGAIAGAFILGAGIAFVLGKSPIDAVLSIALPIMGGGNGAGALPMSKVYGEVTGKDPSAWYAASFATLMLGNIVAVLYAAILNKLGKKYPQLTGNGQLMNLKDNGAQKAKPVTCNPDISHYAAAIALATFCYIFADYYAAHISIINNWLHLGFKVHKFAFMIILAALLNVTNCVPMEIRAANKQLQGFFVKYLSFPLLFMVGLGTNLNDYLQILSIANLIIILFVVLGACLGAALIGRLFHYYPIEAMITAGLCMANAGGSGDVQVLGTADRMELMPYAQISSRIGGAVILLIASFLFSTFFA